MLTVGSLFSGIGGLDLGLERAGMNVIWQSEIDPYASRVLKKHWPEVPNHGDIKTIQWGDVVRPNVLCGGYPCQPFSTAGKRKGEEDPRHLWPWVRTAISELRPDYVVLENVRGHLSLGGTTVIGEITALGYDCEWRVVSAASVGANHRRDRIIIVAYPNSCDTTNGRQRATVSSQDRGGGNDRSGSRSDLGQVGVGSARQNTSDAADTASESGHEQFNRNEHQTDQASRLQTQTGRSDSDLANPDLREVSGRLGRYAADRGVVFSGVNLERGTSSYAGWQWWEVEPDVGRVANGVPARVDRLRGLGNAVVPQVAEIIGRLVVAHAQNN